MIDFNLDDCAEGEELNPSAYNPEDYPTKEEMLDFISLIAISHLLILI